MGEEVYLKLGDEFDIILPADSSTLIEYSSKENHMRAIVDILLSTDKDLLIITNQDISRIIDEYTGVSRNITTDNVDIRKPGEVKHSDIECSDYPLVVTLTFEDYQEFIDEATELSTQFIAAIETETDGEYSYNKFQQIFVLDIVHEISKDTKIKSSITHRKNVYGSLSKTQYIKFDDVVVIDTEDSI